MAGPLKDAAEANYHFHPAQTGVLGGIQRMLGSDNEDFSDESIGNKMISDKRDVKPRLVTVTGKMKTYNPHPLKRGKVPLNPMDPFQDHEL